MKPACCDILEACVNIGIAYSNSSEFLLLDDGIQLTRDQYQWPNFDPGQCMFARDYANRFSLCGLTALGASECDSSQTTFADFPHGSSTLQFLTLRPLVPMLQNIAIGFTGEPVPLGIRSGAIVSMNSHRLRAAAASLTASKSARSRR